MLGRNDPRESYPALYHDERGVCRVHDMTFDGSHWTLNREDPDMFQRFVAEVQPDRVAGAWEASDDRGANWRKDFDLVFDRIQPDRLVRDAGSREVGTRERVGHVGFGPDDGNLSAPRGNVGQMGQIHADAWVSPTAVIRGNVTIGPGSKILDLAVVNGEMGPVTIGENVVVMEHALVRGRRRHAVTIGDHVLVGPHTHLNGTTVEDEVFIATGVSMFPGSWAGSGSELRIGSVLQVNSRLRPGTTVPIGWIAVGDPAELFSPDRHEELWGKQERLDFPGTVYGVDRGTSMREIMRRQSEAYGSAD